MLQHYVQIKIFNDRGRESQSKIDIFAPKVGGREVKITDIAARTIKPDGSIVELKKEDIFERTVVKASGLKVKAKSFAMPGVEPGAIIEYRWREVRSDSYSNYARLEFSRDIEPSGCPSIITIIIGLARPAAIRLSRIQCALPWTTHV